MTMVSDGSRGIADARGGWRDEMESRSPSVQAMRSNTATPNPARESKLPLKKISIADYKNRKAGITTTPKPGATDEGRPGHSRNTSAVSVNTPMSRVPSFEGAPEVKQNGASVKSAPAEKVASKEQPRYVSIKSSCVNRGTDLILLDLLHTSQVPPTRSRNRPPLPMDILNSH